MLKTITESTSIFPSRWGNVENWEFNKKVFNTEDTFMCVLGMGQHGYFDSFVSQCKNKNIIVNIIFDDKAVNCYVSHQHDKSLRQRVVIFEFDNIP